jgi:hypothetical protein
MDANRMTQRFTRVRWLTRLWPVMAAVGLGAGGLVGVWADSFLLTVLLAAAGFLLASRAYTGFALSGMRGLGRAMPPQA